MSYLYVVSHTAKHMHESRFGATLWPSIHYDVIYYAIYVSYIPCLPLEIVTHISRLASSHIHSHIHHIHIHIYKSQ